MLAAHQGKCAGIDALGAATRERRVQRPVGVATSGRESPPAPPYSSRTASSGDANSPMYRIPRSSTGAIAGSVSPPFFGL
jgi:hypothetical protein